MMGRGAIFKVCLCLGFLAAFALPAYPKSGPFSKGGAPLYRQEEPEKAQQKAKGLDQAAMKAVRNAYKFLRQGKPEKALKELEKARRKAPDNFWVNYYSAGAYHMLGQYRQARPYWDAAYASAETQAYRSRVRTAEAYSRFADGEREQARSSLSVALQMDGGNVRARELMANYASPARPGEPQVRAGARFDDREGFSGYFMIEMP